MTDISRAECIRLLLSAPLGCALAAPGPTLQVNADEVAGEIYPFWTTSVTTTQDYFADKTAHRRVRESNPFARYINCVRFLGGINEKKNDFFLGVGPDGQARTDFSEGLRWLQGILDCGFTPRIVLDNVPVKMSAPQELHKYGNTLPPRDFDVWHSYIRQFVQALVGEFGFGQVARWRFRAGTEPDLYPGHWSGTEEDYYKHYDYSVDAVTSIIPEVDIGPGNILQPENPRFKYKYKKWGLGIVDHCGAGKNYKTGKTGTRLCFFASSWYGHVGVPNDTFEATIARMRERLLKYPRFARVPVEIQEFSVLTDRNGATTNGGEASEWAASWMAEITDKVYRENVAQIYQWSTTTGAVPHPRTHVLALLEKMQGGKRLGTTGGADGAGCIAGARNGGIDLLVYRHRADPDDEAPLAIRIAVSGKAVAGRKWRVTQANLIDREHSNYIHTLYRDLDEAGIKPLDKPVKQLPLFGVNVGERYGAAGARFFNTHQDRYKQAGALCRIEPAPALSNSPEGIGFALDLAGHSVVYLRLEA